jgi:PqqD family protein of HPr-rel-A system
MKVRSCAREARFRIRTWGGEEAVVYDAASGDTHLLEPLAVELLRLLEDGERESGALLGELETAIDPEDAQHARHAAQSCLSRLQDIRLVVGTGD